jgi:hypothetical protein
MLLEFVAVVAILHGFEHQDISNEAWLQLISSLNAVECLSEFVSGGQPLAGGGCTGHFACSIASKSVRSLLLHNNNNNNQSL